MSFKDQQWEQREHTLGDIAEGAFEAWCVENVYNYERYGLNRPAIQMKYLDAFVRYTPDYLLDRGGDWAELVEVQGCGQDQLFKFKLDKLDALLDWHFNSQNDVMVWLWDDTNKRCWLIPVAQLNLKLDLYGVKGTFPEGKEYLAIHTSHLDE